MPKPIKLRQFKALLAKIAAERPTFVYNNAKGNNKCFYHPTVRPNGIESRCIIGEALFRLGYTDKILQPGSHSTLWGSNTPYIPSAYTLLRNLGFDEDVASHAHFVQDRQDRGVPWGEAIDA